MTTSPLDLLGTWAMQRRIDDHLTGQVRDVEGTTTLTRQDDTTVRWQDDGVMRWDGGEVPIWRTLYVVRRDTDWWVTFDDGRDFHPWSPGAQVDHACSPDHYRGLVEVAGPTRWTVTWRATGPHKDYTMVSVLTAPASAAQPNANV